MQKLADFKSASADEILAFLKQDEAAKKQTAASYYGFVAKHGKNIPFLTPAEVSKALSVSLKTLERWRKGKNGPNFMRTATGRIRYPIVELEQWVRQNMTHPDSPESTATN
jgi:hypothetical protein